MQEKTVIIDRKKKRKDQSTTQSILSFIKLSALYDAYKLKKKAYLL